MLNSFLLFTSFQNDESVTQNPLKLTKCFAFGSIIRSSLIICILLIYIYVCVCVYMYSHETILYLLYRRILRKPSPSTCLAIRTMHFISLTKLGKPVTDFTSSFHQLCQCAFIVSGLIAWESHSWRSYFIQINFYY